MHARQFFGQFPRDTRLAIVVAAELTHIHRFGTVGVADERRSFDGREQIIEDGISSAIVNQSREQRTLFRSMTYAAARHADLLVPHQQTETRGEHSSVARATDQFSVRFVGVHGALNL